MGRKGSRTRAGDQQVASPLEKECFKRGVVGSHAVLQLPFGGHKVGLTVGAEFQRHTIEQRTIVADMLGLQRIVAVPFQRGQHLFVLSLRIVAAIVRITVLVLRSGCQIYLYIVCPFDLDGRSRFGSRDEFTVSQHLHDSFEAEFISGQTSLESQLSGSGTADRDILVGRSQRYFVAATGRRCIAVTSYNDPLRIGCPVFGGVIDRPPTIIYTSDSLRDIEFATIIGYGIGVRSRGKRPHQHLAESLLRSVVPERGATGIGLATVDATGQLTVGQRIGFIQLSRIEQGPHRSQIFPGPYLVAAVIRSARFGSPFPKALLRKLNNILHRRSEKHCAHISVSDGQRFGHPVLCRSVVSQFQRYGRFDRKGCQPYRRHG